MFNSGVDMLALQEVPAPNSQNFKYLVDKLKYLVGDSNLIDVDALKSQWLKTGTHAFGTSVLYNPNIFTLSQNANPILGNRGATYELTHRITGDKIPVANIHGDFNQQPATM